jgi:4-oxalomesaconate tautomerase
MPGSVAHRHARVPEGMRKDFSVQHPTGEFTVTLTMDPGDPATVQSASLLRTARLIMRGEVFIPEGLW